jgi:hypothetical protein
MKAFTWILIGISIIFLLCLPCLYKPIFENMDNADAVKIANEYVANLTKQRDSALKNAADTQVKVDEAKVRLADAQKVLDATKKPEDQQPKIDLVQSITAELAAYEKSVATYKSDAERFSALMIESQTAADNLQKQGAATTADQTTEASDAKGVAFVAGPDGKMVALKPTGDLGAGSTFYEPGSYKFGSATYVPSYEDSVYLSKTTGQSSTSSYLDPATMKGGACSYYKNQPEKLEEMCLAVDNNNCGAMSCCVLLGGSKCVSGSALGPHNKLNYGDITLRDKDYYYHDGKCYGNCKP